MVDQVRIPANDDRIPVNIARVTVILGSLTAFAPLATDMYLASFPQLAATFNADIGQVQLGLSLFFLGLALGQLVYGPLIDRYGRKLPLLAGIALFIVTSLLITIAPTIESFIVLRLLQAMGGCAGMIVGRTVISDLFKEREAAAILSTMMLIQGLAPILAPIVGGYIVLFAGWQSVFLFLAMFGVACAFAVHLALPETLPSNNRQRENFAHILKSFAALFACRNFIVPTLACSFAFACLFSFISASPFVYMDLYGVSEKQYGWLFGLNAIGMVIAAQLNRVFLKRYTSQTVMSGAILTNVLAGIMLVLFGANSSLPVFVGLLCVCIATVPLIAANAVALALAASGEHHGSGSSIIGVLQFGVASFVSGLVGLTHNGTVYPMTVAILGCGVLAALIWFSQSRQSSR